MSKKSRMITCRNCDAPIAQKAKFCPRCGAKNKKPFFKRVWFLLLLIAAIIAVSNYIAQKRKEKFDWQEIVLSDRLPEPKSNVGRINSNSSELLYMCVEKISERDYETYVEDCRTLGYIVESEKIDGLYRAFDENGYELYLSHSSEEMDIELEAPKKMQALNWPQSEIAGLLPRPKATIGNVLNDTANGCLIYAGETPIEDFNAYIDACAANGFTIDYDRGEKFYNADDANGNHLSLQYLGNKVMSIEIRKPPETEAAETLTEQQTEILTEESTEKVAAETEITDAEVAAEQEKSVDGIRPEFQQAMDSYEEFMNEYCDFMKSYAESDGSDLGLLADYTEYMSKYADCVEDFEKWEDEDMNAAEMAYYFEVQTRVTNKLLEVAQ